MLDVSTCAGRMALQAPLVRGKRRLDRLITSAVDAGEGSTVARSPNAPGRGRLGTPGLVKMLKAYECRRNLALALATRLGWARVIRGI